MQPNVVSRMVEGNATQRNVCNVRASSLRCIVCCKLTCKVQESKFRIIAADYWEARILHETRRPNVLVSHLDYHEVGTYAYPPFKLLSFSIFFPFIVN